MKTRIGFVSNSSSSSFIVIKSGEYENPHHTGTTLVVNRYFGEIEFGWGPERISDIGSKIIFSYFQCEYIGNESQKEINIQMLEKVLKEFYKVDEIHWGVTTEYGDDSKDYGYIDHQSVISSNLSMFDSEENLKDFLFNPESFIQVDNDNY